MSNKRIQSVRGLARALGISHTTVSDALRDSPRVSVKTRRLVQKAAQDAGYNYNPLAGALMSEMRRSGVGTFRGVTAVVDLEGAGRREGRAHKYHSEVTLGAREAAERLGFNVDLFVLGKEQLSISRFGDILESRGIRGLLILPAADVPDLLDLNWDHFAGIYTDYIIDRPPLHSVCPDHFRSMFVALRQLHRLGYRRPGLVLQDAHDRRLLFRWEAAFRMYVHHQKDVEITQPYITKTLTQKGFTNWFTKTKPDVVMSHRSKLIPWMEACGADVPSTHGFCSLNVITSKRDSAGLNLQPRLLGARGMEALIAQLHRNEHGIPEHPSTISIPALWTDGPTLKSKDNPDLPDTIES